MNNFQKYLEEFTKDINLYIHKKYLLLLFCFDKSACKTVLLSTCFCDDDVRQPP